MATYFETHGQSVPQWRRVRRNGATPSGVVVVHTAENATDFTGADGGAEAVAAWMCRRTDYGSYHVLCDADSTIYLVPWISEAWHDTRTNNHSVGISGAVKSADWSRLGSRGDQIVVRMAKAAREYAVWLKANFGIDIPARFVTQAQAMNRVPGFVAHGTMDPGRRSDPGRDFNWDLFFRVYREGAPTTSDSTQPPVSEDDMASNVLWRHHNGTIALASDDGDFLPLTNITEVEALQYTYGHLREGSGPSNTLQLTDEQNKYWNARVAIAARKNARAAGDPKVIAQQTSALLVPTVLDAVKEALQEDGVELTEQQVEAAARRAVVSVLREGLGSDDTKA